MRLHPSSRTAALPLVFALAASGASASTLFADPDGACSPDEEAAARCFTSPGGFVVEVVPGPGGEFPIVDDAGNSHFSYLITGPGAAGGSCAGVHDISHGDIKIPVCPDAPLVIHSSIPVGELLTNGHGDPSCGFGTGDLDNDVFKWDEEAPCDAVTMFTIVIEGVVPALPAEFLLKAATDCDVATILGPGCGCSGSIGDRVWNDLDQDGVQDDGEPGIVGVRLVLENGAGNELSDTQSGAGGAYHFGGLCAGEYRVVVDAATIPEGMEPSPCMAGNDPTLDSDCSPAVADLALDNEHRTDVDFGYHPVPWVYCESEPNSTGETGGISGSGSPSISENDFTLNFTDVPPGQPGFIFFGTSQQSVPFGNGIRCIGDPVVRYRKTAIDAQGNVEQPLDFTMEPLDQIEPGIPYYFQLWFRDPAGGPPGYNTSDALCMTFAP